MLLVRRKPPRSPYAALRARGAIVRQHRRGRCATISTKSHAKRTSHHPSCARCGSIGQDPIGFEAGDANLYRYVGNSPTNATDPSGLKDEWRLDLGDHGGPHIQLGKERWDAVTLEPIPHKGKTPPRLTKKQLEQLRDCNLWDRIMSNVPDSRLERVAREVIEEEVFDEMRRRGARRWTKKVAKEIAEQVLRRTPLLIPILLLSADDAYADCKKRGIAYAVANQVIPADLIEEIAIAVGNRYDEWSAKEAFLIFKKKFMKAGFSEREAEDMARTYMMQWQRDGLKED